MLDIQRNNLDKSSSPYLRQHAKNPIWWQEWRSEVIEEAVRRNKPLFVSVGYATCHWCHVMAADAFSDQVTADYLNKHFICIKVDRETRPDIDQFLMHFITAQNGSGGWPLNVFLTPDIHPIFALTYAPGHGSGSMSSFLDIAKRVYDYYINHRDKILPFQAVEKPPSIIEEKMIAKDLLTYFDFIEGGFGGGQKFPPHTTLLYLLYLLCVEKNKNIWKMCSTTLDAMRLRGLNDHLQGGIFRYCVDSKWTIPHFEKMLYDQAMALWCYALAYRVMDKKAYKAMAENILRCLEECFKDNGLYISAYDADTEHIEGATYIWRYDELKEFLSAEEFHRLSESYFIFPEGNFNGAIHLIRKDDIPLGDIEKKLLAKRNQRIQPDKDNKTLCGINALVAIAMLQAARFLGKSKLEVRAVQIIKSLMERFWDGKTLAHSLANGITQKQSFLFDGACMLIGITMLYENDESWHIPMRAMSEYVKSFQEGEKWVESRSEDFQTIYASWFDHPIPSSASLAEMGLTRAGLLNGKGFRTEVYRQPYHADFYNLAVMLRNGLFHLFTTKK
ncbi:MAG: DUF255 domain-containing protein, partial [Candidatus Atribacteria bacterium]|nr:DUF255 domain-containing protein [Candidatus Atribacteria bacterium]